MLACLLALDKQTCYYLELSETVWSVGSIQSNMCCMLVLTTDLMVFFLLEVPVAEHSFNIQIAEEYGIEKAVIIKTFSTFLSCDSNINVSVHDDKKWISIPIERLVRFFPYMSKRSLNYHIQGLVDAGVLCKGTFNDSKFDRTLWYTFGSVFHNKLVLSEGAR